MPLRLADAAEVARLNARIAQGSQQNRAGATVTEAVEGALVRQGDDLAYPVRDGIPVLLIEEGLALGL